MKHYAACILFFLFLDNDQDLQIIHCFTCKYLQANLFQKIKQNKINTLQSLYKERTDTLH